MITPLPSPPLRSDGPATFADRGDAFLGALPAFETSMNALGAQVAADAVEVASAAPGAVAAANYKGEYAAGTTYQIGHSASYGGDTWYAKTINTGVTPVVGANWQRVVAIPSQTGNAGKVLGTDGSAVSWTALKTVGGASISGAGDIAVNPGDHRVVVHTANGYGSTNTAILRYTTTGSSIGTAITYSDSATLGASFTIQQSGIYVVQIGGFFSAAPAYMGISKNSNELTTNIVSITSTHRIGFVLMPTANDHEYFSATVRLTAGDVIRPHGGTSAGPAESLFSNFSIIKVGL